MAAVRVALEALATFASVSSTTWRVALLTWSKAELAAVTAVLTKVTTPSEPAGAFLASASIAALTWRLPSLNCFSTTFEISEPVSLAIS